MVVAAYILIQQLESNPIAPKVMGSQVQLPALVVLISIAAAYQVAGILGAILAVPVIASARVLMGYVWAKVNSRPPWNSPASSRPTGMSAQKPPTREDATEPPVE